VPFVRFSRDKRGYEHVYLVHASGHRRGKPPAPRVLYWYRTPPGVKVGREPFDETTRRALEGQYPNLIFDWEQITSTPVPPPDPEPWRERRRAERLARQARAVEERDPQMADVSPEPALSAQGPVDDADEIGAFDPHEANDSGEAIVQRAEGSMAMTPPADAVPRGAGRRRRRRGGRGRSRPQPRVAAEISPDAPDPITLDPREKEE
jgi:hypothetical protein